MDINWDEIYKSHSRKESEYLKLIAEPCMKVPKVGDRVLFACGLIGHGFEYEREEAEVLEVADTASKLRWRSPITNIVYERWINNTLITDVLS